MSEEKKSFWPCPEEQLTGSYRMRFTKGRPLQSDLIKENVKGRKATRGSYSLRLIKVSHMNIGTILFGCTMYIVQVRGLGKWNKGLLEVTFWGRIGTYR